MNDCNYIGLALEELYRMFAVLNREKFSNELPNPMLTIQKTSKTRSLGWFVTEKVWEEKGHQDSLFEINICAEYLNREVHDIAETLLHEMVHYANRLKGINDCSRVRHNKHFKVLALKVGLLVSECKKYGYGITSCSPELKSFILGKIKPDEKAFAYFRSLPPEKPKQARTKKTFKYKCPVCGLEVKAEEGKNILCGDCEEGFNMVG